MLLTQGVKSEWSLIHAAGEDYQILQSSIISFLPSRPPVECVNISITRDFLVENDETFFFLVSPSQDDEAVQVGTQNTATITILDEEDGIL